MKLGSDQAKQKRLLKSASKGNGKKTTAKARFLVKREVSMVEPFVEQKKEEAKQEEIPGNYQDIFLQPVQIKSSVVGRNSSFDDENCNQVTSILSKSYELDDDSADNLEQVDTINQVDPIPLPSHSQTVEAALQTFQLTQQNRFGGTRQNDHILCDSRDSDASLEEELGLHNQTSCNVKDSQANNDPSFLFGTTGPISRLALQDACRQNVITETGMNPPDVLSSTIFHSTISATSVIQMPMDEVTSVRGRFGEMAEFMNEIGASKNVMSHEQNLNVSVPEELQQPKCYEVIEQEDHTLKLKLIEKTVDYVPREMVFFMVQASQRITFLDISNCSIVELEGRIFMELKSLVRLNAQKNDIKYVSGKIGDCKHLEIIQLDKNCLESIPQELAELKGCLKVLKLSQNKLKSVNFAVKQLRKLEVLHLQNNCLKRLPQGFEQLQSLKELLLTDNPIENFTLPVHKMSSLQTLSVDWFQYLSPPLAVQIQRTQFSKVLPSESPSPTRNSPLRRLYECVSSKNRGEQSSTQKAGVMPASLVADFGGRPSKPGSSPWRRDSIQPSSVQTGINNVMGNQQNALEPHRVPREFVKNDSKRPRKPDIFGKLIRFCQRSATSSGQVTFEFIQFADHFNSNTAVGYENLTINQMDDRKRTMLHQAASKGAVHIVGNLLASGADAQIIDKYGFNAYGLAMREDRFTTAFIILKSSQFSLADLGKGAGTFGSLMHLAIGKLQSEHLRLMLESEFGDPNFAEQKTTFNARKADDLPLHILMSVYGKDPLVAQQMLKMLVSYGGDINAKNNEMLTPLQCAVKRGYSIAVKDLLELSAELSGQNSPQVLEYTMQSQRRRKPFVPINIDELGGIDGQSCLHFAAQMSFYDIVELLVLHHADLLVRNSSGQTPLSSINNNLLMIKLLKKCEKEYFQVHFQKPKDEREPEERLKFEDYLTDVLFLNNQTALLQLTTKPNEEEVKKENNKPLKIPEALDRFVSLAETQRAMKSLFERGDENVVIEPPTSSFLMQSAKNDRRELIMPKEVPEDVFESTLPYLSSNDPPDYDLKHSISYFSNSMVMAVPMIIQKQLLQKGSEDGCSGQASPMQLEEKPEESQFNSVITVQSALSQLKKPEDEIADLTDSSGRSDGTTSIHNKSMEMLNRMLVKKGKSHTSSEIRLPAQILQPPPQKSQELQRGRIHELQQILQVQLETSDQLLQPFPHEEIELLNSRTLNNSQQEPSTPRRLLGPNLSSNMRKSRQGSLQQRNSEVRLKYPQSQHKKQSVFEVRLSNKSSRKAVMPMVFHDVYSQQMPIESPVRNSQMNKMFGSVAASQQSAPAQQRKLIGVCNSFSASKNIFRPENSSLQTTICGIEGDSSMLEQVHLKPGTERSTGNVMTQYHIRRKKVSPTAQMPRSSSISKRREPDNGSQKTPAKANFQKVKPKLNHQKVGAGLINTSWSVITKASDMRNSGTTIPISMEDEAKNDMLRQVKTPRMQQLFFQRFSSAESGTVQRKIDAAKISLLNNAGTVHKEYENVQNDSSVISKSARSLTRQSHPIRAQPILKNKPTIARLSSVGSQNRPNTIKVSQINKKEVLKLKSIQSLKQLTMHIRSQQQSTTEIEHRKTQSRQYYEDGEVSVEISDSIQYLQTHEQMSEEGCHMAKQSQMLMPVGRNIINPILEMKSESLVSPSLPKFMPSLPVKNKGKAKNNVLQNIPLFFQPKSEKQIRKDH